MEKKVAMRVSNALLMSTNPASYRAGDVATIIGVAFVTPIEGFEPRPCFHIRFDDGDTDYFPISDLNLYRIMEDHR